MKKDAKVDRNQIKALRELERRVVQNRRDFSRQGSKFTHELMKGFEKRRLGLDIIKLLRRKTKRKI